MPLNTWAKVLHITPERQSWSAPEPSSVCKESHNFWRQYSFIRTLLADDALQDIIAAVKPLSLDIKGNLPACPQPAVKARGSGTGCSDLVPAWAMKGFPRRPHEGLDVLWSLLHAWLTHWSNRVQLSEDEPLHLRHGSPWDLASLWETFSSIICSQILLHLGSLNQIFGWLGPVPTGPGNGTDLSESGWCPEANLRCLARLEM